jgi:fatty acid desaturase
LTHAIPPSAASARLAELKAEFRARGFYVKPTGKILRQLLLHLLTASGGLALLLFGEGLWFEGLGLAAFCAGSMGMATNTHTSAHFATSDRRWVNRALTYFGFPLFHGVGATYWWQKHNLLHHSGPNVIGVDDDIRIAPWFAFSQADIPPDRRLRRLYYRVQWLALPFAVLFLGFQLQVYSFIHLAEVWRRGQGWDKTHGMDAVLLVLHWLLWVGLPLALLPAPQVLLFTLLRLGMMGCVLFAVFAPAHFPQEAAVVTKAGRGRDNLLLQTSNTLNFRAGALGGWFCSGLQHQVEHHMFPRISHVYYPEMSRLVAAFCARSGYPYRTLGWGEALWKSALNFVRPKAVTAHLHPRS